MDKNIFIYKFLHYASVFLTIMVFILSSFTYHEGLASVKAEALKSKNLFTDVRANSALEKVLLPLVQDKIIQGYPDGSFKPSQSINRAEAIKIIFALLNKPLQTQNSTPFTDVDRKAWYMPYLSQAYQEKVAKGYADGTFKPTQAVNRVEFITLIHNAVPSLKNQLVNRQEVLFQYSDIDEKEWYIPLLSKANRMGILPKTNRFFPKKDMNRGDAAEILFALKSQLKTQNSLENYSLLHELYSPEEPLIEMSIKADTSYMWSEDLGIQFRFSKPVEIDSSTNETLILGGGCLLSLNKQSYKFSSSKQFLEDLKGKTQGNLVEDMELILLENDAKIIKTFPEAVLVQHRVKSGGFKNTKGKSTQEIMESQFVETSYYLIKNRVVLALYKHHRPNTECQWMLEELVESLSMSF